MAKYLIGEIVASIAGDYRYTSRVTVEYDPFENKVTIKRLENGAVGGMDGPGGSYGFGVTFERHVDVVGPAGGSAKAIIGCIRDAFDDTIGHYGKPTKNFQWTYTRERGLSSAKVQKALDYQRTLCMI
jgi:hypothetical protein